MKSHLIYPAKLKVFGDGEPTIYDSPEEADSHLREQGIISTIERRLHRAPVRNAEAQWNGVAFQKAHSWRNGGDGETVAGLLEDLKK